MKNKKIAVLVGAALMTVGLTTLSGCFTDEVIGNIWEDKDLLGE